MSTICRQAIYANYGGLCLWHKVPALWGMGHPPVSGRRSPPAPRPGPRRRARQPERRPPRREGDATREGGAAGGRGGAQVGAGKATGQGARAVNDEATAKPPVRPRGRAQRPEAEPRTQKPSTRRCKPLSLSEPAPRTHAGRDLQFILWGARRRQIQTVLTQVLRPRARAQGCSSVLEFGGRCRSSQLWCMVVL